MLRSKKYLEIIEQENLLTNAKNIGAFLLSKIQLLAEEFKGTVSNPRGRGLMCAFDLPDKAMRNKFISEVMKQGVVMLGCGERTVRFRPPLTLTLAEAEEGMTLVRNAVKATL